MDLLNGSMVASTVIFSIAGIASHISKHFASTIDSDMQKIILIELFKFTVPWTSAEGPPVHAHWIMTGPSLVSKFLSWLNTPMGDSRVYAVPKATPKGKPKAKAEPATASALQASGSSSGGAAVDAATPAPAPSGPDAGDDADAPKGDGDGDDGASGATDVVAATAATATTDTSNAKDDGDDAPLSMLAGKKRAASDAASKKAAKKAKAKAKAKMVPAISPPCLYSLRSSLTLLCFMVAHMFHSC